jgi:type IV pilus assembly protein PilO
MTTTTRWVAGAVAAALLLVTASWFLLISPQHAQAVELRDQTTQQQATNDTIRLRTQQLKAQFASLPQRQAQLAQIQQQMPGTPDLPALVRQLSSVGDDAGVSVESVSPGPPQALAGSAAGTGTAAGASAGTGTATGTAGVQAIPLTAVVKGSYPELTLFLQKLQGSMRRAYLVENLGLAVDGSSGASTSGTQLTMTVTGKVFVLPSTAASTGTAAGSVAATTPTAN